MAKAKEIKRISDLVPDDNNYNKGTEFGASLIEKSVRKLGAGRSVLADKNGRLIAGNKATEGIVSAGFKDEDIIVVPTDGTKLVVVQRTDLDLNTKRGKELALADNATSAANLSWDHQALAKDWETAETDPIQELQSKIEKSKALQDQMKAANKIVRSGKLKAEKVAGIAALLNCSEDAAARLLEPDFCGRVGFADYQLTNNLARIKQMEQRLILLQKKAQSETTETELQNGVSVVENKELDRLQIFFPGKPEAHIISALKRAAFKWSPSNGCWQRQLTDNARRDLREIKSLF